MRDLFARFTVLSIASLGLAVAAAAGEGPLSPPASEGRSIELRVTAEPAAGSGLALIEIERAAGQTAPNCPAGPPAQYDTLLTKIDVPADRESYGDFCNYGYWSGTSYAGHDGLPPGYWVYVQPHWLIYRNAPGVETPVVAAPANANWGPQQATGAPNTPEPGDLPTAWASQTADGQREWVELTFDAPTKAVALLVYETYNPGALDRVTVYDADGREAEAWAGVDPTRPGERSGVSAVPLRAPFEVVRVRIHLNSPAVPGWNEIDAVGLVDVAGQTKWAKSAAASSTYGTNASAQPPRPIAVRVRRLETR